MCQNGASQAALPELQIATRNCCGAQVSTFGKGFDDKCGPYPRLQLLYCPSPPDCRRSSLSLAVSFLGCVLDPSMTLYLGIRLRFIRQWHYYFAYCEVGFEVRAASVRLRAGNPGPVIGCSASRRDTSGPHDAVCFISSLFHGEAVNCNRSF